MRKLYTSSKQTHPSLLMVRVVPDQVRPERTSRGQAPERDLQRTRQKLLARSLESCSVPSEEDNRLAEDQQTRREGRALKVKVRNGREATFFPLKLIGSHSLLTIRVFWDFSPEMFAHQLA